MVPCGLLRWEAATPAQPADTAGGPPVVGKQYVYLPLRERGWLSAVDVSKRSSAWLVDVRKGGSSTAAVVEHPNSGQFVVASEDVIAAFPME